jgi:hypothetical protein
MKTEGRPHMKAVFLAPCILALLIASVAGVLASREKSPPAGSPQVTLSNTGMEGLSELRVQVHVVGTQDWRELVDLDESKLAARVATGLQGAPGIRLVEDGTNPQMPRLLVTVVGHVIADPEGNRDTAATNLAISLNQPVSPRRPLPSGKALIVPGMTWHRSILSTGLTDSMRGRVDQKLSYLIAQFRGEHARANPGLAAGADG